MAEVEFSAAAMSKESIMVVEDEPDIQELLRYNLANEGYEVRCLGSGEECLQRVGEHRPDLVLLDLMLPGKSGFDVCRELKRNADTRFLPIIIITAKGEDADIVAGLELGAEDYVTKPFRAKVLLARVRGVLRRARRAGIDAADSPVRIGSLMLDPQRREVSLNGRALELTNTEFKLLHLLASHPGRVFTRERIVELVHGDDYPVTSRSVDVQVVGLRRKLGSHGALIETVRAVGYRYKDE